MNLAKQFYLLAKPGIVYGNTLAAVAGYLLATGAQLPLASALTMSLGVMLVVASAGYANNILDINIDRKMPRTMKRPLPSRNVPLWAAYVGSATLLTAGLTLLGNSLDEAKLSVVLAVAGWVGYVLIYGYAKRTTHHSTIIGALPGALPPLIGYTYAAGHIDLPALLLFLMMVFWQMPHFYAISLFRQREYATAGLPLLPLVKGVTRTIAEMRVYVFLYLAASLALVITVPLSAAASLLLLISGLWWAGLAAGQRVAGDDTGWARKVFGWSLMILLLWPLIFLINLF